MQDSYIARRERWLDDCANQEAGRNDAMDGA